MAGLIGRVSKKRVKDPTLVGDEFMVLKTAPHTPSVIHLTLAFFPSSNEAQARTFAAMVQEQDRSLLGMRASCPPERRPWCSSGHMGCRPAIVLMSSIAPYVKGVDAGGAGRVCRAGGLRRASVTKCHRPWASCSLTGWMMESRPMTKWCSTSMYLRPNQKVHYRCARHGRC